jgi:hypothetical protein
MAPTTSLTRAAREYLRVSQDRSGQLRSPAEQHKDNQRAAETESFTLGDPYRETGAVSASKYGKKTREAFALLLADLEGARSVLRFWFCGSHPGVAVRFPNGHILQRLWKMPGSLFM